jgi:hypothetical protein
MPGVASSRVSSSTFIDLLRNAAREEGIAMVDDDL